MTPEIERLEAEVLAAKKALTVALRAAAPQPVKEYTLRDGQGRPVTLSEAFGAKRELIVIHNMGRSCPYCTLWADGFIGLTKHLEDRAAFVLTSPDEPAVMAAFAASRGWPFRVLGHAGTTFARDLGFEPEAGKFWPGVSALVKNADGSMSRTGSRHFGPGDDFCALWPMFDLLADGAAGWKAKFAY